MNNIIRNVIKFPFLFILVAGLGLGIHYSDAGSKKLETQSEEASDSPDTQSEESSDTESEEASDTINTESQESQDTSDTETNETVATSFEEISNITSDILIQDSVTTPTNLTGQISNQSKRVSKSGLSILDEGLPTLQTQEGPSGPCNIQGYPPCPTPEQFYKIKVTFVSMQVFDNHEGALSGDGEYDIVAYVQGKKVGLTDASGPGSGLWDVSDGESVKFDPGTEITVLIKKMHPSFQPSPLRIMTVGSEVDGCGRTPFPESKSVSDPKFLHDSIKATCAGITLNSNDILGTINKLYAPTGYGEGYHTDKSDAGDYSFHYYIDVIPPSPFP